MRKDTAMMPVEIVAQRIVLVRGHRALPDSELARLYGVTTGNLNKAVKRNLRRFPNDFMFQLSIKETQHLIFQIGRSKGRGGRRHRPYVFTEQGVAMLSSVLNSERAVQVNIAIMRAFVKLREVLETNRELASKFAELETRVGRHDEELNAIMQAIHKLMTPRKPQRREIGFHVRDAASARTPQARRH
jgi:hypothetical protein